MTKLQAVVVAAALLTAACGASTSNSPVKSVSTSGSVRVDGGANALAAEDDLGRPNPTIRKTGPIPVQPSVQPATTATQPSTAGGDRCSAGFGAGAVGSRAGSPGKHPPLPQCPVE